MSDAPVTNDILDFQSKKKKKPKPHAAKTEASAPVNEDLQEVLDFSSMKKKKSKPINLEADKIMDDKENEFVTSNSKAKNQPKQDQGDENIDKLAEELGEQLEFTSKKKKKPKNLDLDDVDKPDVSEDVVNSTKDSLNLDYDTLLRRVFAQLGDLNPDLVTDRKRKLIMAPPVLARVGTRKTMFSNYTEICHSLNRDQSHLMAYILAELGTQGSVDAKGGLLIRGRYQNKHMESVLRNYCRNYVLCGTCQSSDTMLQKDSRLLFLHCRRCNSRITVKNVSSGFQAVTGKRAAIRAKNQ